MATGVERAGRRARERVAAGRRRDALDQPREPHRRAGPRRHGHRGRRRRAPARDLGPGLEGLAVVQIAPGDEHVLADIEGSGRDPAHLAHADRRLAQPDPAHVLGRRPAARRRVPGRRLLRLRLGRVRAGLVARRVREPGTRLQLLLGDAVPAAGPHHAHERERRASGIALLPDRLRALRRPRRRRPLLRPVPPRQPAARKATSSRSSTACRAAASTSARTARGA